MIERWDYIDFRIVSFLSRARKGKLHYPWGAWKHRLDVLTLQEASKVRCDLSMRHQLCLIRSNGDMVQDWPCIALNPPHDIPKISKILELRESMQCEDKDPTLYHLALARRGCWIIYRILISIPDCHSPFVRTLCSSSSISIVSPALNNIAFSCLLTCWKPQCLLKISAGLMSPGRWWKEKMFAATADSAQWTSIRNLPWCTLPWFHVPHPMRFD